MSKLFIIPAALLLVVISCGGCDSGSVAVPDQGPVLTEINSIELSSVPEPSGLALDRDGIHFWTVSDQTGNAYRINPSGNVVTTLELGGQDLEGIAVDPTDGSLFVVEEGLGEILHFSREGLLLERLAPEGLQNLGNTGLEGITIDPISGNIFLVKEKSPGLLVQISRNAAVLNVRELGFSVDYSGLAFDVNANLLLVISDESGTLIWCTTDGQAQREFSTGLEKGEGITLSPDGSVIYAVSDSKATLNSYRINE